MLAEKIERNTAVTAAEFAACMPDLARPLAVAVSGGPDSMALCYLLSCWARERGQSVYALTVDHGLRKESQVEAQRVGQWLSDWPGVTHHILSRKKENIPEGKIMESARRDRYALLAGFCREHGVKELFVAHHLEDQAETFLFRLAKGSGLDGLSAMRSCQSYDVNLSLIRPLLDFPKERLIATCETRDIPFVHDPSNDDSSYARVRLRKSYDVLAREGLTAKRLAGTARRIEQARKALDFYVEESWQQAVRQNNSDKIIMDFDALKDKPAAVLVRLIQRAMNKLALDPSPYGPRLEKVEDLTEALFSDKLFRKRTLGGCVFFRKEREKTIAIEREDKICGD